MPMSNAMIPEGRYCDAHTTAPLPPSRRKAPMRVLTRHWRRLGVGAPRSFKNVKSNAPATRNRAAAIRKGGIVSTAMCMPK